MKNRKVFFVLLLLFCLCGLGAAQRTEDRTAADAAQRTFVPPGQYDKYYAFLSGGFNGQVSVVGLPSGRTFRNIPVFSQWAENGYGYTEETKPMLNTTYGFVPWDDAHHLEISQTNGELDGRWLFVNGNNTPRIARIDLRTFETVEILEVPHVAGNHASPFMTMNTEYVVSATRFSVPVPQKDMPIADYKGNFKGMLNFVAVDPESGEMSVDFQILMPGFNYDLAHCGKGPSHGWCFFGNYNTEEAHDMLEMNASQNDVDLITAVNWQRAKECLDAGEGETMPGEYVHNLLDEASGVVNSETLKETTVITPDACEGMVYFLPTPKSPHGVDIDPTGEFIVPGAKLSASMSIHSFSKLKEAIENEDFVGEAYDIKVVNPEATVVGVVEDACLGPLHNEFDTKGNVYSSCFISSEIIKWSLDSFQIIDRIPVFYSIGHLLVPGGDTMKPYDDYVLALNKITKDRYIPTGPELPQSAQLIDINGERMEMLLDFPTAGEPHYGQAIPADKIMDAQLRIYPIAENTHPYVTRNEGEARVERDGKDVHIYATAIRSHFKPDNIEGVKVGDTVYFHVTNLEQDWDVPHGFAATGMNTANALIMPGRTLTLVWKPTKVGVFPFYCTDFCSALHQEMQGYIRVSPADSDIQLSWSGQEASE